MRIKQSKELKRCTMCHKPLRENNKSLLCKRHYDDEWKRTKRNNLEYNAEYNRKRRLRYHKQKNENDNYIETLIQENNRLLSLLNKKKGKK